mgnify:CR=1 FL=1
MNHRLFYTKGNLFYPEPEHGFVDFRGTIEEEFTIFWYRIFNDEDYLKLKEVVTLMQNDKYDEAELKFCQAWIVKRNIHIAPTGVAQKQHCGGFSFL